MAYKVREKRMALGMTQTELAERSKVSRQTINAIENDSLPVCRTDTLNKIAHALSCKVSDIFLD